MKKIILGVCATSLFAVSNAQDCGSRYHDLLFSSATKTTVTYSTVTNQDMDIFVPDGDSETNRPLIVWAHGGSFYGGSKADGDVATLAQSFAKRGYVTASINYRLTSNMLDLLDSTNAFPVVLRAVADAKAAVRYLRANAATYGIDTNNVYFGGNSAGSIIGINYVFLNDLSKATPLLESVINNNGGMEGDAGNYGPSSKIKVLVNLAGGILSPNWIDNTTNIPVVSCHGDADGTIPIDCGRVLNGTSNIAICGSQAMEPNLSANGIANELHVWANAGHCPWSSNPNDLTKVDSIVRDFLYPYAACGLEPSGIKTIDNNHLISVYPNPAQNVINIAIENTTAVIENVRLYNVLGQTAYSGNETKISTGALQNGIYFVEVLFKDNQRAVKRVEVLK